MLDRYYLSYFAYGIENGVTDEQVAFFTKNLVEPDVYFFLDADVRTTCSRIQKYRQFDAPELGYKFERKDSSEKGVENRFISFQNNIRLNYLSHIKSNHIVIDATQSVNEVSERIWNVIKALV